jgi:hypothetical protein
VTFIKSVEEEAVNPVTSPISSPRSTPPRSPRAAEIAALLEPAATPANRGRLSGLTRRSAQAPHTATGPATAGPTGSPVPCCA